MGIQQLLGQCLGKVLPNWAMVTTAYVTFSLLMPTEVELQAKLPAVKASKKAYTKAATKRSKENKPLKKLPKKKRSDTECPQCPIPAIIWIHQNNHWTCTDWRGKKPPDLHVEIATAMFITLLDSEYTKDDLESLTSVVGNRISTLKKGYCDQPVRQALVSLTRTGTPRLKWGKFPWYKQMHELMGASPVVDHTALSNSQTSVDLSILIKKTKKTKCMHLDEDDDSDVVSNWGNSNKEDESSISISLSSHVHPSHPSTPKTPAVHVKAEPVMSGVCNTKYKSLHN
ncbi:hypothetical protein B0H19DRAFT_1082598 [Mycena capillaripes]|nr:hypothetical protein B0H19DRAFT_1082598 [Mycena capillaripes]